MSEKTVRKFDKINKQRTEPKSAAPKPAPEPSKTAPAPTPALAEGSMSIFRTLRAYYIRDDPPAMWHVQFRFDGLEHVVWQENPEDAVETACLMVDAGVDVFGIGIGALADAADREYVNRLYQLWARAKYPFRHAAD